MKKIFKGRSEKGKVTLYDQKSYDLLVWSLNGKDVELTIGKPAKKRSGQENRYYWGVVIKILSEYTGYSDDEMHDALRMMFLIDRSGKLPILRSTASLTVAEFEDYMSKVRAWASMELSCYVPEPNEVDYGK